MESTMLHSSHYHQSTRRTLKTTKIVRNTSRNTKRKHLNGKAMLTVALLLLINHLTLIQAAGLPRDSPLGTLQRVHDDFYAKVTEERGSASTQLNTASNLLYFKRDEFKISFNYVSRHLVEERALLRRYAYNSIWSLSRPYVQE
uniref:Uncharacterized protein n=1 Tax=Glossina pallidipes TaxID=7398 RepID=A0A1B0A3V6_GLOPL